MRITEHLETLSESQLKFAKTHIEELLNKKQAEPKRIVWRVEDDCHVIKNFPESAHIKAAEHLLKAAQEFEANNEAVEDRKLTLDYILVRESELKNYFTGKDLKSYFPGPT